MLLALAESTLKKTAEGCGKFSCFKILDLFLNVFLRSENALELLGLCSMAEYHEDLEMSSPCYYLITKSLFFFFLVVPAPTVVVIIAIKPDITNGHLEFSNYLVLKTQYHLTLRDQSCMKGKLLRYY